ALRSVAVASGLAALVVNYLLCRRAFDMPTAIVSTMLLALLPVNIAYSRFAWDASHSLLATLPVLYLPLLGARRADPRLICIPALLAYAAAILVHPTNVFAAPLLVAPLACARRGQIVNFLQNTAISARSRHLAALGAIAAVLVYAAWRGLSQIAHQWHGPV